MAFIMQINYIFLRNTKLKMAASIVYSCQLRYNLPYINKSVMRPLHIINLSEVNGHAYIQQIQFCHVRRML